jgi:hypothetical protein
MYHPFFRGKQYELISIRDNASRMASVGFVPIIEPVKTQLTGLDRALREVCQAGGETIVIVNPGYGDHSDDGGDISNLLEERFLDRRGVSAGILLGNHTSTRTAMRLLESHRDHPLALIHAGFLRPSELSSQIEDEFDSVRHVFVERHCPRTYRQYFEVGTKILVRDGFTRRNNRDYPDVERFSDLHVTYAAEGADGFGDFLIVGDSYSESGGPAYAIAIHLTFLDPDDNDAMYIYHFKSVRHDTPTDPAGKFAEALASMMRTLDRRRSKVLETSAVREFRSLHRRGHYPGLGMVKKLSMNHHIETLAHYFS